MADKFLDESDWQKFAKGRGLKDAALLKAFAAVQKARDPAAQLEALDDVEKQADALRKMVKGDRELGARLDGIDKAIDKERKLAKAALKEAEAAEADDEEDTPLLLTKKMIPLLRQVRKGDEMQVMVASDGKEVAVLMSRRAISPTRRKMLAEYLDSGSAPKVFLGHCIFEENAHTFVMKTQAAGLAKKVKAALFKQTDLRVKVRVRGEDPNDIDDDGDTAEDVDGAVPVAGSNKPPATATATAPVVEPTSAPDPQKQAYEARLASLEPRLDAALAGPVTTADRVKALLELVKRKAAGGDFKTALDGLDGVDKALTALAAPKAAEAAPTAPPTTPPGGDSAPVDAGRAFNARLKALLPDIQKAVAGPPPNAEVKAKLGSMGALAKDGDVGKANAMLDEIESLLEAGSKTTRPADPKEREAAELQARLQGDFETLQRGPLGPDLREQFTPIANAWTMAQESIETGKFDRAVLILGKLASGGAIARLLEALAKERAQPRDQPRGKPRAETAAQGGAVAVAKLRLKWNAARASRQTAIDSLLGVADVLFETDEYADDPRTEQAAAKVRDAASRVPTLDAKLSDLLDDFADAPDPAGRDSVRGAIQAAIAAYRRQIDNQPLLTALQNTPLGYTPIAETIYDALAELETSLA